MNGRLVKREALSHTERERMLEILEANFSHVTAARFDADLTEKNWVILIVSDAGRIVGFSTLLMYATEFEGERIAVVYSGDTIIEREAWGSAALPRTWIASVWEIHAKVFSGLPLYWLLLTSGFRTYRFLSVFWRSFYPSHREETPERFERLRAQLGRERFGDRYDAESGVVPLGQPLREDLLEVGEERMRDADVAFFCRKNPGYIKGDELVCVAELTESNLTAAGRRMVLPRGVVSGEA